MAWLPSAQLSGEPRAAAMVGKPSHSIRREGARVTLVVPACAKVSDAPILVEMRDRIARWMASRGIQQWDPGEFTVEQFTAQIVAAELFVVRSDDRLLAAVRLVWEDRLVWDDDPAAAGYIHGLMVDERGTGLGSRVLDWAERRIFAQGCTVVRLDCVASNHRLRQYYRERGYVEVGRRDFHDRAWRPVMKFELRLRPELQRIPSPPAQ